MECAWIAGKPVTLDAAIAEAAKLVAASNQTLIAGMGTDVAGARAAIALAERTGAIIDHMHAESLLRDLDVMRSSGVMLTTPTEAHLRADTLLLAGPCLGAAPLQRVIGSGHRADSKVERRIFWLCPGGDVPAALATESTVRRIGRTLHDLPALLAALRARLAGRPAGKASVSSKLLDEISSNLKAARFGVAIWSAAALDALTIEMLCGLVNDLNATTRFSALPLAPEDNTLGVLHVCSWMTGFPMRTGFGRGYPQHDPWLFDGRRLIGRGEADCLIWISAYRAEAPPWRDVPPTIALTAHGANFHTPPRIHIAVGTPAVDHAGVHHLTLTGTLAAVAAAQPSNRISVADAISRIAAALPEDGVSRC